MANGEKIIEAYGTKGEKNTLWRREFKSVEAMLKWAVKNDARITSSRERRA